MSAPSFTQIRRGPMGGDSYTRIHNGVFRDRNLTPNAKAIFGWISTHTEKWEIGIAAIAEAMGMGRPAARTAVALLKERHYLVYGQERNPDGTRGQAWYFFTDLPAQLAAVGVTDDATVDKTVRAALEQWVQEKARSAPGCGFGHPGDLEASSQVGTGMRFTGYPVEPHAVPGPPKKNNVLPEDHQVQDSQARSKENIAPTSPSTHSVDAEFDADAEPKAKTEADEAWVQPGQDEEDGHDQHGSTTDPAVGTESSAPDDLGGGGSGGAARPGRTLDEEYSYCTDWGRSATRAVAGSHRGAGVAEQPAPHGFHSGDAAPRRWTRDVQQPTWGLRRTPQGTAKPSRQRCAGPGGRRRARFSNISTRAGWSVGSRSRCSASNPATSSGGAVRDGGRRGVTVTRRSTAAPP